MEMLKEFSTSTSYMYEDIEADFFKFFHGCPSSTVDY